MVASTTSSKVRKETMRARKLSLLGSAIWSLSRLMGARRGGIAHVGFMYAINGGSYATKLNDKLIFTFTLDPNDGFKVTM